jgi:CubicO group peptidase (beta-lactamase class C family)
VLIAQEMPFLRSILVVRRGCLVYERYFDGATPETLFNVFSVTKSVTSALIGIAIEEGIISSVNDPIGQFLPNFIAVDDPKFTITIEHLLKMLSGLGWNEDRHIGGMLSLDRDETRYILQLPLDHRPGTWWNYSTADSHLLSVILTEATEMSALEYGMLRLFAPLGISEMRWTEDADGYNLGGTQIFWQARDLAKFGLLYLNEGVWDGQQLIPTDWISFTTTPQLKNPAIYELSYAAHWWRVHVGEYPPMFAAVGYGGQYVIVAPEQEMVIVTTANSYVLPPDSYLSAYDARQHEEAILDYVEMYILPAVRETKGE